jgi:membrane-bound lytic murein transglycosylase A
MVRVLVLAALAACAGKAARRPAPAASRAIAPPAARCGEVEENATSSTGDDALTLQPVRFADVPGWQEDHHADALPALLASCEVIARLADREPLGVSAYGGRARDWRPACAAARRLPAGDHAAARSFFESAFRPYAALGSRGPIGKLTGYHVQALRGSRTRHGRYRIPILGRPPDLVSVDLSAFVPDGRGRRVWGRVDPASGALVPYPTRAELRRAPLDDRQVIVWVDDPVDAVFAEIQGSGKVALAEGGVLWIAFAGKNGHRFRGVGGILRRMGELRRGQGTMQGVRAWFAAHPERYDEIVDRNPAKVFFRVSPRAGAIGSQGVVLTPRRSLAVDRAGIALSTPVWVDTRVRLPGARRAAPWRHLLVAQDTGGAILGPVRGDIYWGDDSAAAEVAGRTGGPGRIWLLLPRSIAVAAPP